MGNLGFNSYGFFEKATPRQVSQFFFFFKETILLNQTENKVAQNKLYIGQFGSVRSTVQGQTKDRFI